MNFGGKDAKSGIMYYDTGMPTPINEQGTESSMTNEDNLTGRFKQKNSDRRDSLFIPKVSIGNSSPKHGLQQEAFNNYISEDNEEDKSSNNT